MKIENKMRMKLFLLVRGENCGRTRVSFNTQTLSFIPTCLSGFGHGETITTSHCIFWIFRR